MVFSSLPAYLDPSNWQQQQNHQAGISGGSPQFLPPLSSQQTPPSLLLPPPQTNGGSNSGGGGPGSIRPGSMSDRARMANIPMPEVALKCPRCESTNTKFCYFNNYSLSQPRHFCKTCRRYWTRGGALRSVPVGGGCRRNKRSKGSSSKSPVSGDRQTSSGSTTSAVNSSGTTSTGTPSLLGLTPQIPPLRFMPPLSQFADYLSSHDIGLNYSGISGHLAATTDMNFHLGNTTSLGGGGGGGGVSYLSASGGGGNDQWRLQPGQISSFAGMDLSSGFYPFHHQQQGGGLDLSGGYSGGTGGGDGSNVRPKLSSSSSLGLTQAAAAAAVKMENNSNNQELNLSRQLMGIQGNEQYWNGTNNSSPWTTDLSGFSSSSTTNPL